MLAFAPVLELNQLKSNTEYCCTSSCGSDSHEESQDSNEKNCQDLCNPFLSCSSCSGFKTTTLLNIHYQNAIVEKKINTYQQSSPRIYIQSIWNPPKYA